MKRTFCSGCDSLKIPPRLHSRATFSVLRQIRSVGTLRRASLTHGLLNKFLSAPAQRRGGSTNKSAQKKPEVEAPQLESVASTPEDRRSASIIQAFFRRHRRRAGGPIAAAFERLAKKLKEHTPGSRLERSLLLCLRGPMPHVLAYIRTLKKLSEDTIQTLNRDIQESSHKGIEQLHVKGVEVR